jgi:hypothetical protein
MSATLSPCSIGGLASPSGLLLTSRPPRSSTLSLPLARGVGGRNNLKLVNPTTRHGHGIANGVADGRQVVVNREDPAEMDYVRHFNSALSFSCASEFCYRLIICQQRLT